MSDDNDRNASGKKKHEEGDGDGEYFMPKYDKVVRCKKKRKWGWWNDDNTSQKYATSNTTNYTTT